MLYQLLMIPIIRRRAATRLTEHHQARVLHASPSQVCFSTGLFFSLSLYVHLPFLRELVMEDGCRYHMASLASAMTCVVGFISIRYGTHACVSELVTQSNADETRWSKMSLPDLSELSLLGIGRNRSETEASCSCLELINPRWKTATATVATTAADGAAVESSQ